MYNILSRCTRYCCIYPLPSSFVRRCAPANDERGWLRHLSGIWITQRRKSMPLSQSWEIRIPDTLLHLLFWSQLCAYSVRMRALFHIHKTFSYCHITKVSKYISYVNTRVPEFIVLFVLVTCFSLKCRGVWQLRTQISYSFGCSLLACLSLGAVKITTSTTRTH